jgi:hypothetical protein
MADTSPEAWDHLPARHTPEINRLPISYKWEFLRRHPEYIRWWKLASLYAQVPPWSPMRQDAEWGAVQRARIVMARLTGYPDGYFPDPATPAEQLTAEGKQPPDGQGESARTVTYRKVAELLLLTLPDDVRELVGSILAGPGPGGKEINLLDRHEALMIQRHQRFDESVPGLLEFNTHAPLRGIVEEVSRIVREHKEAAGVEEGRRRPDSLASYLRVWDAREGWGSGRYDKGAEKTLRDIAVEEGVPLQTVASQYHSAYRLIFAEDYDPLRWSFRFRHHLSFSRLATRRKPKAPNVSAPDVTETAIRSGGADQGSFLEGKATAPDENGYRELAASISELVRQGRTAEYIVAALELSCGVEEWEAAIAVWRERERDGLL